jgi:hypothetical protein|tara:strand:- start:16047 stop:16175 length:129 start_codon:yes stop_codon:yes gene_type:complete
MMVHLRSLVDEIRTIKVMHLWTGKTFFLLGSKSSSEARRAIP